MADDLIYPVLESMVIKAFEGLDPIPGRMIVAPGLEVAWDDCCDGQVWTRLIQLLPMVQQGAPGCGVVGWQATIGLGIVRCVATVNDSGQAPSAGQITADASQMTSDIDVLREVITCNTFQPLERLVPTGWVPLGPLGGCAGGEWTMTGTLLQPACS